MKLIEILIKPDGTSSVQTKGFSGSECRDASRFLEQALGKQTSERLTFEFYQSQAVQQTASQRG
jgi:hypothetical protein